MPAIASPSGSSADLTVRIDNAAAKPDLRMQLVDDPAAADFVLVDDGDAGNACASVAAVKSIRLDAKAPQARPHGGAVARSPPTTRSTCARPASREPDAAALFAVIWQNARKDTRQSGSGREFAARD